MSTANLLPIYDQFLDFLVEKATPAEILAFQASEEVREDVQRLLERLSDNSITPEERVLL